PQLGLITRAQFAQNGHQVDPAHDRGENVFAVLKAARAGEDSASNQPADFIATCQHETGEVLAPPDALHAKWCQSFRHWAHTWFSPDVFRMVISRGKIRHDLA